MFRRPFAVVLAAAAAFSSAALAAPPAQAAPNLPCVPVLQAPAQGRQALAQLGTKLGAVAARNGHTVEQFRALAADSTFWVDQCGLEFYVEPVAPDLATATAGGVVTAEAVDLTQTFALNSKPGSQRTIYLDFDGYNLHNTSWMLNYFKFASTDAAPYLASGYDADGQPASFSDAEKATIQEIWRRVAEDYSAFDVNVTTQKPAAGVLERTDAYDAVYGTTALITNDVAMQDYCGCGGIAYVGVYDQTGTAHEYYQPALVFVDGLGTGAKNISEATSHEVGHNLGLSHDGTTTPKQGYYTGGSGWAPIMGVGYYEPVSTWSKGEYNYASNTEDDYSLMAANGVRALTDSDNTIATATPISAGSYSGVISAPTDKDWFSLTAASSGTYTFNVGVAANGPNLDAKLSLYNAAGTTLLASNDPALTKVSSTTASGLGASVSYFVSAGTTVLAQVDGVGYATSYNSGTDYGSVGQYTLTLSTTAPTPPAITAPTLTAGIVGTSYRAQFSATGGTSPYAWSVASSSLPGGVTLAADTGLISGTPTAVGSFSFTVTVRDGVGSLATTSGLSITVQPALAVSTGSLPGGLVGSAYSTTLVATGGQAPYVWSLAAGSLPATLSLDSATGTISGTPVTAASYSLTVLVTDGAGKTATKALTLSVINPIAITTSSLAAAKLNRNYSATIATSGGSGTKTWSWAASGTSAQLPPGLRLSTTGVISGKPTARGTYYFTVRVSDASGTASRLFTLVVG